MDISSGFYRGSDVGDMEKIHFYIVVAVKVLVSIPDYAEGMHLQQQHWSWIVPTSWQDNSKTPGTQIMRHAHAQISNIRTSMHHYVY